MRPSAGRASAFPQVMLLPTATATPDLLSAAEVNTAIAESSIPKVEIAGRRRALYADSAAAAHADAPPAAAAYARLGCIQYGAWTTVVFFCAVAG